MKNYSDNKNVSMLIKIAASFVTLFLCFIVYIFINFDTFIDNTYKSIAFNIGLTVICFFILISIRRMKLTKYKAAIVGTVFLFLASIFAYNVFISTRIESLIYLHDKYNINYADMKVKSITSRSQPLICIDACTITPRSATILYNQGEIRVYYVDGSGWADDFTETTKAKANDLGILNDFDSILKSYTGNYKIFHDATNGEYAYDIFFLSNDNNSVNDLISKLDNYINNYRLNNSSGDSHDSYITYSVYITKDKELYNQMIQNYNKLLSAKFGYQGQLYAGDALPTITGLSCTRITGSNNGYNSAYFINNGNITDKEYIAASSFKDIVFWYDSEPNAIEQNSQMFYVFGLK